MNAQKRRRVWILHLRGIEISSFGFQRGILDPAWNIAYEIELGCRTDLLLSISALDWCIIELLFYPDPQRPFKGCNSEKTDDTENDEICGKLYLLPMIFHGG